MRTVTPIRNIAELQPGTQILYVPNHADGPDDPACEEGFVMSVGERYAFCRYFYRRDAGHSGAGQLRTRANSEATKLEDLLLCAHRPQAEIDALLAWCLSEGVPYE